MSIVKTKLVKQEVNFSSTRGLSVKFFEMDVLAENANQFVVSDERFEDQFLIIAKPNVRYGGYEIDDVWAHEYEMSSGEVSVIVQRYKLLDGEPNKEFFYVAAKELQQFEVSSDVSVCDIRDSFNDSEEDEVCEEM